MNATMRFVQCRACNCCLRAIRVRAGGGEHFATCKTCRRRWRFVFAANGELRQHEQVPLLPKRATPPETA